MSARDALSNALWDNYTRAQKNEFIDAFAHELAEQQRDERPQHNPDWQCWGDAADLIDPATKGDPVDTSDPNHWSSWTDTPPPSSHAESGVPQAMALATAGLPEHFSLDAAPDGLGTTERDATGKMVLHLCDPDCHGASHEEYLTLTEAP